MPEQVVIDGLEFARTGKSISGALNVGSLKRLQDSLASSDGVIDYSVRGGQNPKGRALLHLTVKGALNLRCQRCLGPLAWSVDISTDLLLLQDESEFADLVDVEDDSVDGILAAPKMDLAAMVEDEIILRVPFAPRHPEGACEAGDSDDARPGKDSPFAVLANLTK